MHPPDMAVVPPKTSAFSMTNTRAPVDRADKAALRPAAPEPTITTSYSDLFVIHEKRFIETDHFISLFPANGIEVLIDSIKSY